MKFIGCSAYPLCDFVEYPNNEHHHPQVILEELCPLCGSKLAYRYSHRDGKKFIACTGFPKCRYTRPANMTAAEYEKFKADKAAGKVVVKGKGKKAAKKTKK
jgi:ssDNA-binding Zn-finger/Zn-ribbon topoisomerase 1